MKRNFLINICLVFAITLTACTTNDGKSIVETVNVNDVTTETEENTFYSETKITENGVKVSVLRATDKMAVIKLANDANKDKCFSGIFGLEKKNNGEWESIRFSSDKVKFPKTVVATAKSYSDTYIITWGKYFSENMEKGVYRITIFGVEIIFNIN